MEEQKDNVVEEKKFKGTECDVPGCLMCGNSDVEDRRAKQTDESNFNFKSKEF